MCTQSDSRHPDVKILAAQEQKKTLDILHHSTEPQSLKSRISCPLPAWQKWKCLKRLFSKAHVEEGVDDENLWGQQQVPASWMNLHVLMMSAGSCMAPHHWQKLSTAATGNRRLSAVLCWNELKWLFDVNCVFKLWAFTWLLNSIRISERESSFHHAAGVAS